MSGRPAGAAESGRALLVGITDLVRHPGERREVRREVVLDHVEISTAAVPAGAAIEVDLVLEAILGGLVAEGTIRVPWTGQCRRCLEEVTGTAVADVREVFERSPTEGETYPLGTDTVDLAPMVRDAAVLALPLAPLCEDGCRGPAPDEFPTSVVREEDGATADDPDDDADDDKQRDPRWAALDQLKLE